ncbi:unnamed protein product [Closterium sp. Yama58-4]|nr:unnamed protein product [Closterium sp. Yama58-4]
MRCCLQSAPHHARATAVSFVKPASHHTLNSMGFRGELDFRVKSTSLVCLPFPCNHSSFRPLVAFPASSFILLHLPCACTVDYNKAIKDFILHLPCASAVDYNKALKECARQGKLQLALTLFHALRRGCRAGGNGGGDSSTSSSSSNSSNSSSGGSGSSSSREPVGGDLLPPPGVSPEVPPERGVLPGIAPGVAPDMFTYRSMMDVCAACGAGNTAAEIIQVSHSGVRCYLPAGAPTLSGSDMLARHTPLPDAPALSCSPCSSLPFRPSRQWSRAVGRGCIVPNACVVTFESTQKSPSRQWSRAVGRGCIVPNSCVVNCALNACIHTFSLLPSPSPCTSAHPGYGGGGRGGAQHNTYVAMVEEDGVVPNTYVVNSALNACISDWDATWSLWFRMERAGNELAWQRHSNLDSILLSSFPSPIPPNQRLGVTPDATTFNTLLKACAAHSRPDAAQLLENSSSSSRRTKYLDVYTYSTVIQILAQSGRFQAAFAVKSDMDQSGVRANVVTWTSLIGACARAGFVDHAFRVFEEMVGSGCEATTAVYNLMIDMCAEAGLEDRAVALLREMQAGGRRGSPQRARTFVGEMRAAGYSRTSARG